MKKQTILKTAATAFLFLVFCLNAGSLRADSGPDSLSNAQQQAKVDDRALSKSKDQDLQEEKSERFKKLEFLIKENLMTRYQKLEGLEEEVNE